MKETLKNRKRIVGLLLMLSLILTTGTFAFWATNVEGTNEEATGTLAIGSGTAVSTVFELTNELNSGGLLVPTAQLSNSGFGAVDSIDILHTIAWNEVNSTTQLTGTKSVGLVGIQHRVIIVKDGEELLYEDYENIYSLVEVTYDSSNPSTLILNNPSEEFIYHVTLIEPSNQEEYNLIEKAQISIEFYYIIGNNDIKTTDVNTTINIVETDAKYFKVSKTESNKIYDFVSGSVLDVVIPKTINGVDITVIGSNVFLREGINSIILQEGITLIDTNAFHSNNLTTVHIPSTVELISYNAFNYNEIETVVFEEGLKVIRAGAFGNNKITTLHLPSTVTEVAAGAFGYGENFITEITIGDDVEIGSTSSFGWYGKAFMSLYNQEKQAGTYLYIDGQWIIES